MTANLYIPRKAVIKKITPETSMETRFKIAVCDDKPFSFKPGQFIMLSIMGIGEAPFSITSDSSVEQTFEICIRKVGTVSKMLHNKNEGDTIGIRGPYGTFFDTKKYEGHSVIFVAGGLGLVPLRPAIIQCIEKRDLYNNVTVLYGSKNIKDMVYKQFIEEWENGNSIEVDVILDNAEGTNYKQGLITALIDERQFEKGTHFVICGPPIMYRFVIMSLMKQGVDEKNIWLSFERHMKCGVGKCGHCRMDGICVCQSGPVFNYTDVKGKRGAT